ncbi:hypothetical protein BKA64DRAFT_637419 [Cadophora sp. MPI-SDFR-AT-0126]|nr:hypothetical protein BKA64DRAFT_637419 [Leotiomycetes sp. MPI-SDFR-AT-0126]
MSRLCLSCLFPSTFISTSRQSRAQSQDINSPLASQPARKPAGQPVVNPTRPFSPPITISMPTRNRHEEKPSQLHKPDQLIYSYSTPQTHRSSAVPSPMQNTSNHITFSPSHTIAVCNLVASASSLPLSTPTTLFLQAQIRKRGKPNHPALYPPAY